MGEWKIKEAPELEQPADGAASSPRKPRSRWVAIAIPLGVAAVALLAGPPIIRAAQEAMTPRFEKAAEVCELVPMLVVADKGETLTLTTAGEGGASYTDIEDVACVLSKLEVPSYVVSHIDSTRALDGQQTDEWDGISARWTYHPEDGLHLVLRET